MLNDIKLDSQRKRFSRALARLNRINKMSKTELERLSGVSRRTIFRIEKGFENVTLDTYFKYLLATDPDLIDEFALIVEEKLQKRREEIKQLDKAGRNKIVTKNRATAF